MVGTEKGARRLVSSGGGPMVIGMLHEVARDPEEQTHRKGSG